MSNEPFHFKMSICRCAVWRLPRRFACPYRHPWDPPPTNSPPGSSPGCRSVLPTFHKGRFPSRCLAEFLMHLLLCASLVTATAPIPQDAHSGTNIYYWFRNFKPIVAENPVVAFGWVVGFARRVRWGHTGFRRRRRRAVSCHRWQGLSCMRSCEVKLRLRHDQWDVWLGGPGPVVDSDLGRGMKGDAWWLDQSTPRRDNHDVDASVVRNRGHSCQPLEESDWSSSRSVKTLLRTARNSKSFFRPGAWLNAFRCLCPVIQRPERPRQASKTGPGRHSSDCASCRSNGFHRAT